MNLKDQTYDELLVYGPDDRAILAVRCEKVRFINRGTRSSRVIIETRIVAGMPGAVEKPFSLSRFSQEDPLMKVGQTYLVAAYKAEWVPAWSLIDWVPIDSSAAEQAIKTATEELEKRISGKK